MKKILILLSKISNSVREKSLTELDREIISLFNKIELNKCSIDRFSYSKKFITRIGDECLIVEHWEYWVKIKYANSEVKVEKKEHSTVCNYALEIFEKVDSLYREKKEREFIKTLQTDFLG